MRRRTMWIILFLILSVSAAFAADLLPMTMTPQADGTMRVSWPAIPNTTFEVQARKVTQGKWVTLLRGTGNSVVIPKKTESGAWLYRVCLVPAAGGQPTCQKFGEWALY